MKTRLSILSNGDCVSLDDVRSIRVVDGGSLPKVELIYTDGTIIMYQCGADSTANNLRDEIVSIVNEFEVDVKEQKEAEKLEQINKDKVVSVSLLDPVGGKV